MKNTDISRDEIIENSPEIKAFINQLQNSFSTETNELLDRSFEEVALKDEKITTFLEKYYFYTFKINFRKKKKRNIDKDVLLKEEEKNLHPNGLKIYSFG